MGHPVFCWNRRTFHWQGQGRLRGRSSWGAGVRYSCRCEEKLKLHCRRRCHASVMQHCNSMFSLRTPMREHRIKGASIYDIRRRGDGGSRNAVNLWTYSTDFADIEEFTKSDTSADVIYGRPLSRFDIKTRKQETATATLRGNMPINFILKFQTSVNETLKYLHNITLCGNNLEVRKNVENILSQ